MIRKLLLGISMIHVCLGQEIRVDQSSLLSVYHSEGSWRVQKLLEPWTETDSLIARANFTNSQQENGWMILEIQTRPGANDEMQAIAAGIAEGYLTRTYIAEKYKEFYAYDTCKSDPDACSWIKDQFKQNTRYIHEQVQKYRSSDPYWHQVGLLYSQMEGIHKGYQMRSQEDKLSDEGVDEELGVLMLNLIADYWDLIEKYKVQNKQNQTSPIRPSCSVLIKHVPERNDIIFAHNTWHEYRAMGYRLLKNYQFNMHTLPDGEDLLPGNSIAMSSYAGVIVSLDDFYLTSAKLATTETTLFIFNKELFRKISPIGVVYEPIRVMTANRLATTGQEWVEIFKEFNSGTYNNEWMVVDYKMLEGQGRLPDGVLTVLEQLPGKIVFEDQTQVLREKSYWASYNRAFYPEIFSLAGFRQKVQEYGDWFTHDKTPRALIYVRNQTQVHDVESMMRLERYNNFEEDPFAVVEGCNPPRTPAGSIANRLDLSDPNQTCDFEEIDWMVVPSGYGALDAKVASKESFPDLTFYAVAGPTTSNGHKPFQWSHSKLNYIPSFKPIDKFDFNPFNITWVLNHANSATNKWTLIVSIILSLFSGFM